MRRALAAMAFLLVASCGEHDVTRMIGARCDDSDECDQRCLQSVEGYPGGFCTLVCDDDRDCPGDSACVDEEGGVCLFTCQREASCDFLGVGWTCAERDGRPEGKVMVCRGD
jgi:hypothetical protein